MENSNQPTPNNQQPQTDNQPQKVDNQKQANLQSKKVYIADKDMSLSFDANMPDDQIAKTIRNKIYAQEPAPVVSAEGKEPFVQAVADRLYHGFNKSVGEIEDFATFGMYSKLESALGIETPAESEKKAEERTKEDNPYKNFALDFSSNLGYMAPMIATQDWIGSSLKTLSLSTIPQVSNFLKYIPNFALGWGAMGFGQKVEQGKNPIEATTEGLKDVAEGTMFGKVGELAVGKNFGESLVKQIPFMSAASMAQYAYESLSQGQMPTQDGFIKSGASGAAMGATFAALPEIISEKNGKEKVALQEIQNKMQEQNKSGNIDPDSIMDEIIKHPNISDETKNTLKESINKVTDEITGGSTENKGVKTNYESINNLLFKQKELEGEKEVGKEEESLGKTLENVEENGNKLLMAYKGLELKTQNLLKENINVSDESAENITNYNEEVVAHGRPLTSLTPEENEINEKIVKPFLRETSRIYNKITGSGVKAEDPNKLHQQRYTKDKGSIWDNFIKGTKRIAGSGGKLKRTDGSFNTRNHWTALGEDGVRRQVHISDGRVTYLKKDQPKEDWGGWKQSKNIHLMNKKIKPIEKKISVLNKMLRALESIKVKDPVSINRLAKANEYVYQLQDILDQISAHTTHITNAVVELPDGTRYEADSHEDALNLSGKSKENSVEGKDWVAKFKTNKPINGQRYFTREEAKEKFGIDISEDIDGQRAIKDKQREKLYNGFQDRIVEIDKKISAIKQIKDLPVTFEKGSKIDNIEKMIEDLYKQQMDIHLSDINEQLEDWATSIEEENKQIGNIKDDTERRLHDKIIELKTLMSVKKGEELNNIESRAAKIKKSIDELSEQHNAITNEFDPDSLEGKSFVVSNRDSQYYGKRFTIKQSTIPEIEQDTNTRYYKNSVLNSANTWLKYKKMELAHDFIESVKDSPQFNDNAIKYKEGISIPEGWRIPKLRQFSQYYVRPEWADTLDYLNNQFYREQDSSKIYNAINDFLRTAIFFNPAIHIPNEVVTWYANRGARWINPSSYPRLWQTTTRAMRAVRTQNEDFVDALMSGLNITPLGDTLQDLYKNKLSKEVESEHPAFLELARHYGEKINPYKIAHNITWASQNVLTLQAMYEAEAEGMTREAAFKWARQFIPDYIKPSRIFGNAEIANFMNNSKISMFGSYHYGIFKGYGEMLRIMTPEILKDNPVGEKVFGEYKKATAKEKLDVAGKVAALGVLGFVIYPAMDDFWKKVTGNEKARVKRAGYLTIPEAFVEMQKRQISPEQFIQDAYTPSAGLKMAMEILSNKDWVTGKQLYSVTDNPADVAGQLIMNQVAPLAQAQKVISGKESLTNWVVSQIGVKTNDPDVARIYNLRIDKEDMQRKIQEVYMKDPAKAEAMAQNFNEKQAKDLIDISQKNDIDVPKNIMKQFMITTVAEESLDDFYKMRTVADYLKKHKKQKRKSIYSQAELDSIDEKFNNDFLDYKK